MKIAIIGGTHGNEPVGLEVINALSEQASKKYLHEFTTFHGNPKAFEEQKRFIDCDLNRTFGKNGIRKGYEKKRAEELESLIVGKFDFCIDIHTTTTNMGLTVILNNTHETTRKACAYLQKAMPEIKLIEEDDLDSESKHLSRMTPGGIIIEVGPVANNVLRGDLVQKVYQMVESLLGWDFSSSLPDISEVEYYKVFETLYYPQEKGWYIHPDIENHDFEPIKKGQPLFINIKNEVIPYEGKDAFPFFINEAAYLNSGSAMILATIKKGF